MDSCDDCDSAESAPSPRSVDVPWYNGVDSDGFSDGIGVSGGGVRGVMSKRVLLEHVGFIEAMSHSDAWTDSFGTDNIFRFDGIFDGVVSVDVMGFVEKVVVNFLLSGDVRDLCSCSGVVLQSVAVGVDYLGMDILSTLCSGLQWVRCSYCDESGGLGVYGKLCSEHLVMEACARYRRGVGYLAAIGAVGSGVYERICYGCEVVSADIVRPFHWRVGGDAGVCVQSVRVMDYDKGSRRVEYYEKSRVPQPVLGLCYVSVSFLRARIPMDLAGFGVDGSIRFVAGGGIVSDAVLWGYSDDRVQFWSEGDFFVPVDLYAVCSQADIEKGCSLVVEEFVSRVRSYDRYEHISTFSDPLGTTLVFVSHPLYGGIAYRLHMECSWGSVTELLLLGFVLDSERSAWDGTHAYVLPLAERAHVSKLNMVPMGMGGCNVPWRLCSGGSCGGVCGSGVDGCGEHREINLIFRYMLKGYDFLDVTGVVAGRLRAWVKEMVENRGLFRESFHSHGLSRFFDCAFECAETHGGGREHGDESSYDVIYGLNQALINVSIL